MNIFETIFKELNHAGIDYLIVGGIAVNLHGYRRFTADIDILLALNEENITRMDGLMRKLNFLPRIPVELKDLKNDERVKELLETKGMQAYTMTSPGLNHIQIDIMTAKSLQFKDYEKNKVIMDMEVVKVPVIALSDLIVMKKSANRSKDLSDVQALLDMHGL